MINEENIIKNLERNLNGLGSDPKLQNVGFVEKNTDGVITVTGLSKATMGELVEFENGVRGVVLNLDEDYVSIILLDEGSGIREGDKVKNNWRNPFYKRFRRSAWKSGRSNRRSPRWKSKN